MASEGIGGGNPPSVNLWIGNLSPEVSDAELKALLEKYGEVDSVTSHSSRNYAFVYFNKVEDAKSAKEGLQGYALRGRNLKIDFARPTKPCKSLWVAGISPSDPRDEVEKLFLQYGKIQEFRLHKDGTTAFVDYVQMEDAIEALKNLNGKRFGNSQFRVDYLRSQSAKRQPLLPLPQQGYLSVSNVLLIRHPPSVVIGEEMLHYAMILFGEIENVKIFSDRSCAFVEFRSAEEAIRAKEGLQGKLFNDPRILIEFVPTEFPLVQLTQADILGLNRFVPQGNSAGLLPLVVHEPDVYMNPTLMPHGVFLPPIHGHEFLDMANVHKLQNGGPLLIGEPNWRASPAHGAATSTKPVFNVPKRSGWDVHDANLLSRDTKRVMVEPTSPGTAENHGRVDGERGLYGLNNPEAAGGTTVKRRKRHSNGDCIWRGLISKGGTTVCHARCVAIGEGVDADIPRVVNCSARTSLDLLAKHYEDAIGFDAVFFLPDSEDDFAAYTDFLRYLGSNDRAGVAKFDDGTTFFLVPPSKFLSKVLEVSGPERLYGVVLRFPPAPPDTMASNPPPVHPSSQADPHNMTKLQTGYGNFPLEARPLPFKSSKVPTEDSPGLPRAPLPASSSYPAQSGSTTSAVSQIGPALTPELIATLTSLLPASNTPSLRPNPSMLFAISNAVSASEPNIRNWKHEQRLQDQNGHLVQQVGGQFSSQFQHLQAVQASPSVSNSAHQISMPSNQYNQISESSTVLTHGVTASYSQRPVNPLQVADQRLYNSSFVQQPAYPTGLSNQAQVSGVASLSQPYNLLLHSENISNQTPIPGVAQEGAESEADKNERYKTTLLFAANLLSKIHQPSSNPPGQGAGS